jgi:hypothetical protein
MSVNFSYGWFNGLDVRETLSLQHIPEFWKHPYAAEAKPGEYGGCFMAEMHFPIKNCGTRNEGYNGALTWWRINKRTLHNSTRLRLTASISLSSTSM